MVGILAQRLVRVLCPECKSASAPNALERMFLGEYADGATVYHPEGCEACGWTGFRGRTGIYELVTVDDHARTLIHDQMSEQAITEHVRRDCPSISDDGRRKVLDGVTSVNEVMRAVVLTD